MNNTYAEHMTKLVAIELTKRGCYNKGVVYAIVAQAIVESNYGKSTLAKVYHNHFGLTCGVYWKGNSINMSTKEEINGSLVDTRNNFRVYRSDAEGVSGFFDFISTKRYENLQSCTTPEEWLKKIKSDGYCTASDYVEVCMKHVNMLLTQDYLNTRSLPSYKKGSTYTLKYNMTVRQNPLRTSPIVGYNRLTTDGKKHDKDKNGTLDKGTLVTCKDVYYYSDEVWIKIPSGWVCGYDSNYVYVR